MMHLFVLHNGASQSAWNFQPELKHVYPLTDLFWCCGACSDIFAWSACGQWKKSSFDLLSYFSSWVCMYLFLAGYSGKNGEWSYS